MTKILGSITAHLPRVTVKDVGRFSHTAKILDAGAFAAELQSFLKECVGAVELTLPMQVTLEVACLETVHRSLARKAVALRSETRWLPSETDIQRGRAALLEAFDQPHNLPLSEFAKLANKSRQQVYKDIEAGRLLALNVGPRGQKLPDWQLDPMKQRLTQSVLQGAAGIDAWTLYRALSEPLEGLGGRSPVEAATAGSIDALPKTVFSVLGVTSGVCRELAPEQPG